MKDKDLFSLKGKVAIVTGGTGFLGSDFSETLAAAGANVVIADVNKKVGPKIAKQISDKTKKTIIFRYSDVSSPASAEQLAQFTFKRFRRIDLLVNAALMRTSNFFASVENYTLEDWNQVIAGTAGGTFWCSRAVSKFMKKKKSGSIINIGSIYGQVAADQRIYGKSGINSSAAYAAGKAAVLQLTKYLAVYWAAFGIRVNAISPGGVYNHQDKGFISRYCSKVPLGKMLDKKDLRGALLFLASDASSNVTGHNLFVDGGWTAW